MASNPNFTATGNNSRVNLTTANTTRDLSSTTNAALLVTAAATGTRIDTVTWTHSATSQTQASIAAVGRVWICTTSGGAKRDCFNSSYSFCNSYWCNFHNDFLTTFSIS